MWEQFQLETEMLLGLPKPSQSSEKSNLKRKLEPEKWLNSHKWTVDRHTIHIHPRTVPLKKCHSE